MAKCDLSIELDNPERAYHPGAPITGRVRVKTSAACRCDGLKVAVGWYTHGRGNTTRGDVFFLDLFTGEWAAGLEHSYEFELQAPLEPRTYHGHLVNLDYRVHAVADIPWALDPKAEELIAIAHLPLREVEVEWDETKLKPSGGVALLGCGILLGGLTLAATIWAIMHVEWFFHLGVFHVGVPAGIVALLLLAVGVPRYLITRKLGRVRAFLERTSSSGYRDAYSKGLIRCAIQSRQAPDITQVTAQFRAYEKAVHGSGTSAQTYTHPLAETLIDLKPVPGQRIYEGMLDLPVLGDIPAPFTVSDNAVKWDIGFHVEIPDWPDWKHKITLTHKLARRSPRIPDTPASWPDTDDQMDADRQNASVVAYLVRTFYDETGIDISSDEAALTRVREAAEKAKHELLTKPETEVNLPFLSANASGPKHLNTRLRRGYSSPVPVPED